MIGPKQPGAVGGRPVRIWDLPHYLESDGGGPFVAISPTFELEVWRLYVMASAGKTSRLMIDDNLQRQVGVSDFVRAAV